MLAEPRPGHIKKPKSRVVENSPTKAIVPRVSMRYARMNSLTGRLLVFLVILSAIPVASNRPAWWLLAAFLVALGALGYLLRAQYLMGAQRRLQVIQMRGFILLALVVPLYAVLQALPLATLLPAGLTSLPAIVPAEIWPTSISVSRDASLLGAIRAMGFILFLILVFEIGTQPVRSRGLLMLLMLGILLHAIFGMVALRVLDDFALWGTKEAYRGVLTGTFINRNSIATFLGFGLVLALALTLERGHRASLAEKDRGHATLLTPQRLEIMALWAAILVLALAILLTESRMGAFATAVGGFVTFLVLRIRFGTAVIRIITEAAIVLVVAGVVLLSSAGSGVTERALFTVLQTADRMAIYDVVLRMIAERPLTGFGYDAFPAAFQLYRDEGLISHLYFDMAHNTYLTLWVEQGLLVGSVPILLLLWAVVLIAGRFRKGEGDPAVLAGALGVICVAAVHSLADFSLEIPANVYCFLFIVGLAIAPARNVLSATPASITASDPAK